MWLFAIQLGHIRSQHPLELYFHRIKNGNLDHMLLVVKKESWNIRQMCDSLHHIFAGNKSDYSMLIIYDESDEVTCPPTSIVNTGVLRPLAQFGLILSTGIVSDIDPTDHFNTHSIEYTATPQAPHAHPPTLNFGPYSGHPNPFHSYAVHVLRTPADRSSHLD